MSNNAVGVGLVTGEPGGRKTKTWLVTGASRGFGREFARAALRRGDSVAATARDVAALQDLRDEHPGCSRSRSTSLTPARSAPGSRRRRSTSAIS
ncbi:MAG TPA: SDR family NAD(P)-dependent oxidoreductase, partial [Trebonia sp.]